MLNHFRRGVWIAVIAAIVGASYSWFNYGTALSGAVIGAANGLALHALEVSVLRGGPAAFFRSAPFLVFLTIRVTLYTLIVVAIFFVSMRLFPDTLAAKGVSVGDGVFSLAMCIAFNVIFGLDDLLGPGVLVAFVAGRYHRPRREEHALLFIDMRNSTAAAERLGEERFLALLNAFFADVTQAIAPYGGTIHKYVGDETIATWPLGAAGPPPRCVEACLAAGERLAARAAAYVEEFGQPVEFRAALHGGLVVVGELGYAKREIAFIGDAMNTTARLVEACRSTGKTVLASAELLARLGPLPAGVSVEPLAPIALRGKAAPFAVSALVRNG